MAYRFSWLAGTAGVLLALVRLERVLRSTPTGPPWELALVAGALLGAVITWVAISYRVGPAGTAALNSAGLVLASLRLAAPESLVLGFLPSVDAVRALYRELALAVDVIRFGAPPVAPAPGLIVILIAAFWVMGMLLAWGLLKGRPIVALLPSLLFYLQIATIDRSPPGLTWTAVFLIVAAGGLLAVALDERNLTAGRLRPRYENRHVPMSAPALPAAFVALSVLLSVVATGVAVGMVPEGGVLNWRSRSGFGSGVFSGVSFNLFANITQVDLVSRSEEPVFTAQIDDDQLPARELYWKLISLEDYDGENWFPRRLPTFRPESRSEWADLEHAFQGDTVTVQQTITIEALRQNVLPVLHSPTGIDSRSDLLNQSYRVRADGSIPLDLRTWRGLEYQVTSNVPIPDLGVLASLPGNRAQLSPIFQEAAQSGVFSVQPEAPVRDDPPSDIGRYLGLPADLDSIETYAEELVGDGSTAFEKAMLLEAWFRDPDVFTYSVDIDPGHSARDLGDWLLEPDSPNFRTGYCEQFATAMAVMARTIDIPSRVVLGFTPGEATANGEIIVRGRNAHAWVELWMNGQGWVRFDPTPRSDGINPSTSGGVGTPGGTPFDPREYIPVRDDAGDIDQGAASSDGGAGLPIDPERFIGDIDPLGEPASGTGGLGSTGVRTLLMVGAGLIVLAPPVKWVRRRRRLARLRRGDITGAWDEIVDRLTDLGSAPTPDQTPLETASTVGTTMVPLASAFSEFVYGPLRPLRSAQVAVASRSFEETERVLRGNQGAWNRARASLSWRSLKWWDRA